MIEAEGTGSSTPLSLSASGVTCRFGTLTAVDDVSLVVDAGACVALVGESGSGKTTLLRCFNGMVTPAAGRVVVGTAAVGESPLEHLRRGIGYVQQHGGLLPHWRVLRNVALVPGLIGHRAPEDAARNALGLVGLDPSRFGARFPHELSGGQRQRVALARALAARPGVVLLDEPFGALDAITRADVQSAFAAVRRDLGVTTLLVTHDLLEAARLADEVVVMRAGRIEQRGAFDELHKSPATEYVRTLFERALASVSTVRGT